MIQIKDKRILTVIQIKDKRILTVIQTNDKRILTVIQTNDKRVLTLIRFGIGQLFDQRVFANTGAAYIPAPELLTPLALEGLLARLEDPAPHAEQLEIRHWKAVWGKHLRPPNKHLVY